MSHILSKLQELIGDIFDVIKLILKKYITYFIFSLLLAFIYTIAKKDGTVLLIYIFTVGPWIIDLWLKHSFDISSTSFHEDLSLVCLVSLISYGTSNSDNITKINPTDPSYANGLFSGSIFLVIVFWLGNLNLSRISKKPLGRYKKILNFARLSITISSIILLIEHGYLLAKLGELL